jgi:hypothetical protein
MTHLIDNFHHRVGILRIEPQEAQLFRRSELDNTIFWQDGQRLWLQDINPEQCQRFRFVGIDIAMN